MAKIVTFNSDVPSLKANPAPEEAFEVTARVAHVSLGTDKDMRLVRVQALGTTKLYQRDFRDQREFFDWLRPAQHMGTAAGVRIWDAAIAGEIVRIPLFIEEEGLVEHRFKRV